MTYNTARRKPLSKKQRATFLAAHDYTCHWCNSLIVDDQWDDEHIIPREMFAGAEADDMSNRAPIHRDPCHKAKTAIDKANIAKSNAIRQKHGLDPVKKKPHPKMKGRGFDKRPKGAPWRA